MDRSRFTWLTLLTVVLTLSVNPIARSQTPSSGAQEKPGFISKVYSLSALGDDAALGTWISETIPEVIQPGTWGRAERGVWGKLSYFGPAKVLVVYHTPEVHAQVDDFLKSLKKALPAVKEQTSVWAEAPSRLMQAQFAAPAAVKPADAQPAKGAYPIPAPLLQPKHLFHVILRDEGDAEVASAVEELAKNFNTGCSGKEEKAEKAKAEPAKSTGMFQFVIRYEGDGLIDANVVEVLKSYMDKAAGSEKPPVTAYAVPTSAPTPPPAAPQFSGAPVFGAGPPRSAPTSFPPAPPSPTGESRPNTTRMPLADDAPVRVAPNPTPAPPAPPLYVP